MKMKYKSHPEAGPDYKESRKKGSKNKMEYVMPSDVDAIVKSIVDVHPSDPGTK